MVLSALPATAAYGMSWYDTHLRAYAEVHGLGELLGEDCEHGRHYGTVRTVNPFLPPSEGVHEPPPLHG